MSNTYTDSVTDIEPANRPGLLLPPDIGLAEVAERLAAGDGEAELIGPVDRSVHATVAVARGQCTRGRL